MFVFFWKDTNTFKRHMEEMESFRLAHKHPAPLKPDGHTGTSKKPVSGNHPRPTQPANGFTSVNGKKIVVPIWGVSMPKGSQN
jgi:hypothetical protein